MHNQIVSFFSLEKLFLQPSDKRFGLACDLIANAQTAKKIAKNKKEGKKLASISSEKCIHT